MATIQEWLEGPAIKEAIIEPVSSFWPEGRWYAVGHGEFTKIERISHGALHCDIPYIRVWKGEKIEGEFCLHQIVGIICE